MKIRLDTSQWGFYFDPKWLIKNIYEETEVPEKSVVILKDKSYIEEIERTIIGTSYYLAGKKKLRKYDKREISDIMAELMISFMNENNYLPPDTSIKKQTKNITTLSFKPNKYDEFNIKIRRADIKEDPAEFIEQLKHTPYSNFDASKNKKVKFTKGTGEWVGNVKDRLVFDNLRVVYTKILQGQYGDQTFIIFVDEKNGNQFKWFASGDKSEVFIKDEVYKVKATIKKHNTYQGKKENMITRVVIQDDDDET